MAEQYDNLQGTPQDVLSHPAFKYGSPSSGINPRKVGEDSMKNYAKEGMWDMLQKSDMKQAEDIVNKFRKPE